MSVVPLDRAEGGAVVSLTDITERKQAELDAQRSRQELAHFTRVSTMGALTASLAHEINQPLAGILTNAQAARRFLEASPPALGELREILPISSRTHRAPRSSSVCATCSARGSETSCLISTR